MATSADLYPSRQGDSEALLPRLDPVVYSTANTPLGESQCAFYRDNGYLIFPGLLADMVAPLRNEIGKLKRGLRGCEELVLEPDSNELRTVFNPIAYSTVVDRCFRDERIVAVARQLLGSEVYRMQSRINIKPPLKGRAFSWHSDFETWHVEDGMPRMRALTAWVMLTENHSHNGPLYVIPGSHRQYVSCAGQTGTDNYKTSLRQQTLGVPSPQMMQRVLKNRRIKAITGEPGTLVIHECNLLHASPDNLSADARSIAMCVYNSVENAPQAPFSGLPPRPAFLSSRDTTAVRAIAAEAA